LGSTGPFWQNDRAMQRLPDDQRQRDPANAAQPADSRPAPPPERGGPPGPEPTRYGDWEKAGRCIDF
jgi:shikimate dehydrogenase